MKRREGRSRRAFAPHSCCRPAAASASAAILLLTTVATASNNAGRGGSVAFLLPASSLRLLPATRAAITPRETTTISRVLSLHSNSPPQRTLSTSHAGALFASQTVNYARRTERCRRRRRQWQPDGTLRATVASWPTVEGGTGGNNDDGQGQGGRRATTNLENGAATRDELTSSAVEAGDGVVLIEQEGPRWTEIVWDPVCVICAVLMLEKFSRRSRRNACARADVMVR